jgi:hypothetical protein
MKTQSEIAAAKQRWMTPGTYSDSMLLHLANLRLVSDARTLANAYCQQDRSVYRELLGAAQEFFDEVDGSDWMENAIRDRFVATMHAAEHELEEMP